MPRTTVGCFCWRLPVVPVDHRRGVPLAVPNFRSGPVPLLRVLFDACAFRLRGCRRVASVIGGAAAFSEPCALPLLTGCFCEGDV